MCVIVPLFMAHVEEVQSEWTHSVLTFKRLLKEEKEEQRTFSHVLQ